MANKILLLKDFNTSFPKEFINQLQISCPDALTHTVKGETDFNRWQLANRIDSNVIDCVNLVNTQYDNILESVLEIAVIPNDPFSGFIEFDDNGREHWKQ